NLVFKPFTEVSADELQRGLTSKLIGPFLAVQQALPHLSKQGSIVFFSGLAAYRPSAGSSVVAAVNAGLEGLAKALAVELAPIRVNVISPGVIDTPLWDSLHPVERQAFYQSVANHLLVRRIGQPAEVAQAAVFAMSNGFVTGSVLHVEGGGRLS
ncbi:MAG TPA: SDR family oxidoreductase, partial [Candidatus Sulfotelmatobacter sp.]|nr:SDR family oxidoreductase [Candidatus Sulfotelmatobacter sp.]